MSGEAPESREAQRLREPTFGGNHMYLGQILLLQGQTSEALKEMEAERRSDRDIGLALVYYALGQRVESDVALDREKNKSEVSEVSIATVYAYRARATKRSSGSTRPSPRATWRSATNSSTTHYWHRCGPTRAI